MYPTVPANLPATFRTRERITIGRYQTALLAQKISMSAKPEPLRIHYIHVTKGPKTATSCQPSTLPKREREHFEELLKETKLLQSPYLEGIPDKPPELLHVLIAERGDEFIAKLQYTDAELPANCRELIAFLTRNW
jgi:hypothetical protein